MYSTILKGTAQVNIADDHGRRIQRSDDSIIGRWKELQLGFATEVPAVRVLVDFWPASLQLDLFLVVSCLCQRGVTDSEST